MTPKKTLMELAASLDGIPILGTLPGSPAARAGVRYGDVLLSVNGMRTRTWAEYLEAKDRKEGAMDLVVFRAGEAELHLRYDETTPSPTEVLAEVASMRVFGGDDDEPGAAPHGSN